MYFLVSRITSLSFVDFQVHNFDQPRGIKVVNAVFRRISQFVPVAYAGADAAQKYVNVVTARDGLMVDPVVDQVPANRYKVVISTH